ncbi:hypothetical protein [Streptomyces sp. SD15]
MSAAANDGDCLLDRGAFFPGEVVQAVTDPFDQPPDAGDLLVRGQRFGKARAARGETDVPEVPAKPAKKAPSPRASSRNAGRAGGRRGTPTR